ncbi:MAG: hypothetical protein WCX61_05015 [Candidatus Peribacteraceae bacterium]
MTSPFLALRTTLIVALAITLYFAYVMLFTPPMFLAMYEVDAFDAMHRYLSMVSGALLVTVGIGMLLVLLRPVKYASIVMILIIYHFARFVVDLILIVQGDIAPSLLIPEMVYFLVMCVALIRFYPVKPRAPKEKVVQQVPLPKEPIQETMS